MQKTKLRNSNSQRHKILQNGKGTYIQRRGNQQRVLHLLLIMEPFIFPNDNSFITCFLLLIMCFSITGGWNQDVLFFNRTLDNVTHLFNAMDIAGLETGCDGRLPRLRIFGRPYICPPPGHHSPLFVVFRPFCQTSPRLVDISGNCEATEVEKA